MHIIEESLSVCEECGQRRGHIIERYNGLVPVYCNCDLWDKEKKLANPCAICYEQGMGGHSPIWKPISDYRDEWGHWIHVPHFAGPSVRKTAPGWEPPTRIKTWEPPTRSKTWRRAASVTLIELDKWIDQITLKRDSRHRFVAIARKNDKYNTGRCAKQWTTLKKISNLTSPSEIVKAIKDCCESLGIDIDFNWTNTLDKIAYLDWCFAAVIATQMELPVPTLPSVLTISAQRALKPLGEVVISVEWGYDLHNISISLEQWIRVLNGEVYQVSRPYYYEGERFTGNWYFDINANDQLTVTYDDAGVGWIGTLDSIEMLQGPEIEGVDLAKAALEAYL